MTTPDPLLAFVEGKNEVTADDCARHFGLALDLATRTMIGLELRRAGWRKYRVRRNGALSYAFQRPDAQDPEYALRESELRAFLKYRDKITIDECCYALRILPGRDMRTEIARHLKRWRWVRVTPIVRGRLEWTRQSAVRKKS